MPTITYTAEETAAAAHFAAQTSYGSAPVGAPTSALLRATEEIRPLAGILAKHKAGIEASVATADLAEAIDDRVNALLVEGTGVTLTYDDTANTLTIDAAGGGGTIDGSGTADYVARWVDSNTLGDGALRDNGTRAAIGDAPASDARFTVKAQSGDSYCLAIYGTGGVIVPTVLFKHSSDTNGVKVTGDDTGFAFSNAGEGVTIYVKPGYPESYLKTHPSSAGRFNFQTHDGSDYVSACAITGGKFQLWDGAALVDVSIGATDSESSGFRSVRVPN